MAIFSSFLKSPPESPTTRRVPNGGLGGFVQLRGKEKNTTKTEGGKSETQRTETDPTPRSRKEPPPPIRVNSVDIGSAPIQSAPLVKDNDNRISPAALWKVSHPPIKSATGTAFVVAEVEVQDLQNLSSNLLWKDSTYTQAVSNNKTDDHSETAIAAAMSKIPSPVELPGSLLLPDKGYRPEGNIASPSNIGKRPRAYSEQPTVKSSEKTLTSPSSTSQGERTTKTGQRGNKAPKQSKGRDKSASSTEASTPTQVSPPVSEVTSASNVNVMSAEELIRALPKMKPRKLATEWLPAMEKEIGKYKGLLHMYSNRTEVHARHIDSICLDLKNLLRAMKNTAGIASEQFEKAQADIDVQQRTDLEKLKHTEDELQEALQACSSASQEMDIRAPEFQHLKSVLYRVVATLGGCIRNNLAFKLYHSSEGLSEEVVKVLRAYKQWDDHTLKTFPSLVPAELYENAEQKAKDLQQQVTECQKLIAEQQVTISRTTKANEELSSQVKQSKDESEAHKHYIKTLEAEIATLPRKTSSASDRGSEFQSGNMTTPEDAHAETVADDIITMYARQTDELEQRNSVIVEQNALIEELLRQVNEISAMHDHDNGGSISSPDDYFQAGHLQSGQATLERNPSSASHKRLLGSRTLSRAITPISRSMSYLLSPHEHDSSTNFSSQLDARSEHSKDTHSSTSSTPQSIELHDGHDDSYWANDEHGAPQPSATKKTTILPYPRDSIMGIESLARLKIATQQTVKRSSSIRRPSPQPNKIPTGTLKRSSVAAESSALSMPTTQQQQPLPPTRSPPNTDYPSIDSRLHELSTPLSTSMATHNHNIMPVPRQEKTIIQGLRDVQLPARLVSDTHTMAMSEQEKKTLSLISEKSDVADDEKGTNRTVGLAM